MSTNQSALMLPKLKDDSDVNSGSPGNWQIKEAKAFDDVASSLDYKAPGAVKNVSSVPTIWPVLYQWRWHYIMMPIQFGRK